MLKAVFQLRVLHTYVHGVQLSQFDGQLFQQIDGAAVEFSLAPLLANAMMCAI